jgi:hypothetical protein
MRNGTQLTAYSSVGVMSALGHKRTFALQYAMSALPPKADMCGATRDVCYGPKVDIQLARLGGCPDPIIDCPSSRISGEPSTTEKD